MQKQELRQKQEYTETDGNGTAVPRAQPSLIMPTARTIPPQGQPSKCPQWCLLPALCTHIVYVDDVDVILNSCD